MTARKRTTKRKPRVDPSTLTNSVGVTMKKLAAYFDTNADMHDENEIREVYGFLRQSINASEQRALLARQTSTAFEGRFVMGETPVQQALMSAPQRQSEQPRLARSVDPTQQPQLRQLQLVPPVSQPRRDPAPDEFGITEIEMED